MSLLNTRLIQEVYESLLRTKHRDNSSKALLVPCSPVFSPFNKKCCYFCSTCVHNSVFSRPSGNLLHQLFLPSFIVNLLLSAVSLSAGTEKRRIKTTGIAHTGKDPSPGSSDTPAQGQLMQRA